MHAAAIPRARRWIAAFLVGSASLTALSREVDLADAHEASGTQKGTVLMSVSVSGDEPLNQLAAANCELVLQDDRITEGSPYAAQTTHNLMKRRITAP